jgi:hypothetical protein
MKPLPEKIHRNGVYYEQIKRTDRAALYSMRYEQRGTIIGFDVFRIIRQGGGLFKGKLYPPYEQFPPNTAYGSTAFSFTTLEAAEKKYSEIRKQGSRGQILTPFIAITTK